MFLLDGGIILKDIIVASNNSHKIEEIQSILKEFPVRIIGLKEAGIDADIEENGETFIDNAYIKAKGIYDLLENKENFWVLSDDSGLSVEALNGEPGVYSARYAGKHGDDKANNEKLLKKMKDAKDKNRAASFACAMVLIVNNELSIKVQGEVKGFITEENRGCGGFGYDPLFYVPEFNKTFGELSNEEKNSISHRGNALELLKKDMRKIKLEE